ncbi:restriction endonuclease [Vibrio fluvialis]|nr:hypothetical protein [Vibrio fluvialis]WMN56081.1 restriction endonuclease [Vibrio fluvialis]
MIEHQASKMLIVTSGDFTAEAITFAQGTTLVVQEKAEGFSQSKTAEVLCLGIATVKRHWNKLKQPVLRALSDRVMT